MKKEFKKRSFQNRLNLIFHDFRRKGLVRYILIKSAQVIVALAVLIILYRVIDRHFIDLDLLFEEYVSELNQFLVFGVFLASESFLGLLPPDFFIIWADQRSYSVILLTIIGVLSYIGGINSYFIGRVLVRIPFFRNYISKRNEKYVKMMNKWGAIFLSLAAFLPLPFSPIGMFMGMIKYPFKSYAVYTLTRILRFYAHGVILFNLI